MSNSLSVHPPYATPFALLTSEASLSAYDAFAAPSLLRTPYVPPDARIATATAVIDAPAAAVLVSGARVDTPMPGAVAADAPELLPSIDQFLMEPAGDDGAATMGALFAAPDAEAALDSDATCEAAEVIADTSNDLIGSGDEPWAIADASEAVAELADGLVGRANPTAGRASEAGVDATTAPLEPWTDDERWMDIMPALPTPGGPDLAGETAWARAFAEPPAPLTPTPRPAGDTEAAARSLEAIARQLRAGELDLPGYRGDRGDAAALAAALSALLGASR